MVVIAFIISAWLSLLLVALNTATDEYMRPKKKNAIDGHIHQSIRVTLPLTHISFIGTTLV
jgi:hypothetical protein